MLDKNGTRQLAYVVVVDAVTPIPGYDRVELAHISGWTVVVGKGEFHIGDPAIYFEIDSQLPEVAPFTNMEFLAKKHYKIKTQKMCKSLSQGLLMSAANFGWTMADGAILDLDGNRHSINNESRFLTAQLGVTYAEPGDNKRKATSVDKYKKMAQRHPNLNKNLITRKMMKTELGKKILYLFFGRGLKKTSWPDWVRKTDEERCQNLVPVLFDGGAWSKESWIATEKIDGSSSTYAIKRRPLGGYDFYVCSRNVVQDTPDKKCFYDSNIYWEIEKKYHIRTVLETMMKQLKGVEWITLQGEIFGENVQKRDYSMNYHDFRAFNLIFSNSGRKNPVQMTLILKKYGIPCVPVVDQDFHLPATIDELLSYADGVSVIDGKPREGIVFRSQDGSKSFKAVSNSYLLKYHQ